MKRITCVIVDDEISAIKNLEKFVQQISQLELIGSFTDPIKALEFLKKTDVYLVFMDISMEGLSGLDMARLIHNKVVFITGHGEFALASWKLDNVIGYLTKPIFFEDIVGILKRVSILFSAENLSTPIQTDKFLAYKRDDEVVRIEYDKIIYIEARKNYSWVYLENKEEFVPIPLWEIEKILPKSKFVRVSKSTIANASKILDDDKEITLIGGFKLKPGKAYKHFSEK